MLMKRLAHVWSQNEIVLIFLIDIIHTESLPRRVCKSCDNIMTDHFCFLVFVESLYLEWILSSVLNAIVVVDSLLSEVHVLAQSDTSWSGGADDLWTLRLILWHLHQWCWTRWHRSFAIVIHR